MATKIASLFADLDLKDGMTGGLKKAEKGLDGLSDKAKNVTSGIGSMFAGLGVTLSAGLAISGALDIDRQMSNIRSVTGATKAEIGALRGELIAMGSSSTLGAAATVEAFYDIAGGVSDASKHMAILTASMQLAEAGQADLGGATKGMISIMNAYGFAAEKAGMVSDVFSRAVGLGVGSMDEFVAAMSPVGGTMNAAGISISEFGASMALLTQKGATASQSATRLQAVVTALLNPNTKLAAALKSVGVESGSALLKQEGLAGALRKLNEAVGGSTDEMAKMLGSTEALQGALALLDPSSLKFFTLFDEGLAGATATARELQLDSPSAKFDILRNRIEGVVLQFGTALLPILERVVDALSPIIEKISELISGFDEWATANPELANTLINVALGVGGLAVAMPILSGVSSTAAGALRLLVSPLTALAGIALFAGGEAIEKTLSGIGTGIQGIVEGLGAGDLTKIGDGIKNIAAGIIAIPVNAADKLGAIFGLDVRKGIEAWQSVGTNIGLIIGEVAKRAGMGGEKMNDLTAKTSFSPAGRVGAAVEDVVTAFYDVRAATDKVRDGFTEFRSALQGKGGAASLSDLFDRYMASISAGATPDEARSAAIKTSTGTMVSDLLNSLPGEVSKSASGIVKEIARITTDALIRNKEFLKDAVAEKAWVENPIIPSGGIDLAGGLKTLTGIDLNLFVENLSSAMETSRGNLAGLIEGGIPPSDGWLNLAVPPDKTAWESAFAYIKVEIQALVSGMTNTYSESKGVMAISGAVGKRAAGGPVFAGRPYIVGERGPELFIPHSGGGIVPNHAMPRSGGGKTIVQLHLDGKVIYETILKERRAVNARDF